MKKSKADKKLIIAVFLLVMSLQSHGDIYLCKAESGLNIYTENLRQALYENGPLVNCSVFIKTKHKSVNDNENSEILWIINQPHAHSLSNQTNFKEIKLTKVGKVYEVPVKLNGVLNINFVLDSGASEISITPDVALTLLKTGTIRENDWLPGKYYQLADGSWIQSKRFRLKSVHIGDRTINDVACSISNNIQAPMLLGQNVLEQLGKYTFDYNRGVLILR